MAKGRKPKPEDFDFNKILQPAGEELRTALDSLLHGGPEAQKPANAADPAGESVSGLRLKGVRTRSQGGDATRFRLGADALVLVIDIVASENLLKNDKCYHANFQVLDYGTNNVVLDYWLRDLKFEHGAEFWIYIGNTGPSHSDYTTPEKWGLHQGLYSFRAVLELEASEMFCRSEETLFRVCRP